MANQPLRNILHSPKASGRLIIWAIELGEFDIKYKPRTTIKAQVLADFVIKCTINDPEVGGQEIVTPEGGEKERDKEITLKEYWEQRSKIRSVDVRAKNLKVCKDSRLVVAQVNGEFETKDDTMAKYLRVVKRILTQFDEWYAEHIPREENTTTDALSHFSLFEIENYPRSIYFQVLNTPTIHVINLIAPVGVTSCWIDPIKTHLETGWIPGDAQEARKLSVRALRYSLIEGLLYKRSFVIPYLKCLRPLEAEETLKKSHEGICGQHLGGRALAHKIIRLGFYWPTMIADAKAYVKKYDRCQRHAPIAKALAKITTKQITQFFWENVIYRYGIPRILVTDNGKQFDNAEFRDYRDDNSIKLCFTSVAHPQENGHAEVANRIILDGFKKMVERSRNTWVDELLPIQWAYHTTCKVTTEATPFMWAYRPRPWCPLKSHMDPL
ncbi:uncharacterized protein LOC141660084 [Apium graveolens]|uniref:uncharacterized protein LOC141660084 n=1 Tax=Apium graveolens TaxID=4045 RepID=UPI003D7A0B13